MPEFTIWLKVCAPLTITTVCGLSPACWKKLVAHSCRMSLLHVCMSYLQHMLYKSTPYARPLVSAAFLDQHSHWFPDFSDTCLCISLTSELTWMHDDKFSLCKLTGITEYKLHFQQHCHLINH